MIVKLIKDMGWRRTGREMNVSGKKAQEMIDKGYVADKKTSTTKAKPKSEKKKAVNKKLR
ncbi:MAG: hypothetical protein H8E57_05160 [Candidatus Cloacimonetes bacterium]|nr:hypothetical protein [Candidatus Cloacimonadota bacterium]